jgi:mono/diheme cytochrome c family protein
MKTLILIWLASAPLLLAQTDKKVDFVKDIQPILRDNCIKCHGPDKQKGKLRLDSREMAFKGGVDGEVLVAGQPEKSDLYRRINLPPTDDEFMPNKADPLTKPEIDLIRDWIKQGAVWPESATAAATVPEGPVNPFAGLTELKPSPAEQKAIEKLTALGMPVRPVAQNMNWQEANLALRGTNVTDETLRQLRNIPSLVGLNLGGTAVTDSGLTNLVTLTNLVSLHLENTRATDAGLASVKALRHLSYLNLYGTAVTDAGLNQLSGLTNLHHLFLWQTKVTDAGVTNLQTALPKLVISRGGDLVAAAKKEEPKKEEPKKEEPKK